MEFFTKIYFLVFTFSFWVGCASAQTTYTSVSDGNWNTPSTWDGGVVPNLSSDTVNIAAGTTVNFSTGAASLHKLTVQGALNISGGTMNVLPLATSTSETHLYVDAGALNISGGTVNVGTSLTSITGGNLVRIDSDSLPVSGSLNIATSVTGSVPAGTLSVEGNTSVNIDGSLTVGGTEGGNIELASSGVNFTIDGGTVSIASTLFLNGGTTFTVAGGTLSLASGNSNEMIAFEADPVEPVIFAIAGGTVNMGSGSQTLTLGDGDALPSSGSAGYQSLNISGGTLNLNGGLHINDANAQLNLGNATININPQHSQLYDANTDILLLKRGHISSTGGAIYINNPHSVSGSGYAINISDIGDTDTGDYIQVVDSNIKTKLYFGDGSSFASGSTDGFDLNLSPDLNYERIEIDNASGTNRHVEVLTGGNTINVKNLYLTNGTLDVNDNLIKSSNGIFYLNNSSRLIIGNTDNTDHFPSSFSTHVFGSNFTVEYDGNGPALVRIKNGAFKNLIIGGTGSKTILGSNSVSNVLTLQAGTLVTNGFLTMNNASTLIRSGSDTEGIMTGTIAGGHDYTVRYEGDSKTIQTAEWSGTGNKDLDLSLDNGNTLTAGADISIADAALNSGILDDGGFTLTVAHDLVNNSEHTGSGKILLTGGTVSHSLGGDGNGIFGNLELDDTQGVLLTANQQIDGILTLTSGLINIDTYLLTFGATASIDATAADNTTMIQSGGTLASAGVKKIFDSTGSFLWPVGVAGKYTPVTLTVNAASTFGNVTLQPIDAAQPDEIALGYAIDYYWQMTSSGFSGVDATHIYSYEDEDITGGNEYAYIPGYYNGTDWLSSVWDVSGVDEAGNMATFENVSYLDGSFTVGEPSRFGQNPIYESLAISGSGDWSDTTSWNIVSGATVSMDNTIPGSASEVYINDDFTMNVMTDNTFSSQVTISADGTLKIDNGVNMVDLGTVLPGGSGGGTLEIVSNSTTATDFPEGTYTSFVTDTQSSVVYSGTGSYTLSAIPGITYPTLVIGGTGTVTLPDTDLTVNTDFALSETVSLLSSTSTNGNITVGGNADIPSGTSFTLQPEVSRTINIEGNMTVNGTLQTSESGEAIHQVYLAGNLENNGVLDLANDTHLATIILDGTTQSVLGNGVYSFGDLNITGGANVSLPGDISILGDLNASNGSLLETTTNEALINFSGTSEQQLSGITELYGLAKLSGGILNLSNALLVTDSLSLSSGIINSTSANILTLGEDAVISGGSGSSYIDGAVQQRLTIAEGVTVSKSFPLGSDSRYRSVTLDLTPSSVDTGTATESFATYYAELKSGSPSSRNLPGDNSIHHISSIRYYTIEPSNNNGIVYDLDARVSMTYNDDDNVDTPSELRLVKSSGTGDWLNIEGADESATGSISSVDFHSFSDFVLASSTENNPLPISLLAFDATGSSHGIDLVWKTASEENNDYFVVERSADGKQFTEVLKTEGAGQSSQVLTYQETDITPLLGKSFYRLKQVDYNGIFTYSKIVTVHYQPDSHQNIRVMPNPVVNREAVIDIKDLSGLEKGYLYLLNSQGVRVKQLEVQANKQGELEQNLRKLDRLSQGVYTLVFSGSQHHITTKVIIK